MDTINFYYFIFIILFWGEERAAIAKLFQTAALANQKRCRKA